MNGSERSIMTGTTNGGKIGGEGRAWLNDVNDVVTATTANNNSGTNLHITSLSSQHFREPPPQLRTSSNSLFQPPISMSLMQEYSPETTSHIQSQFSPRHGTRTFYTPERHSFPSPYQFHPLQFSPHAYSTAASSINPQPYSDPKSYPTALTSIESHPNSTFLPPQYASMTTSHNESATYTAIPSHSIPPAYGPAHLQYAIPESSKDSKMSSALPLELQHTSRKDIAPEPKNLSPGVGNVDNSPNNCESSEGQEQKQESCYRVPSGKEGSLKHRILTRPPDIHIEHSAAVATKSSNLYPDVSPKHSKPGVASPVVTSASMCRKSNSSLKSQPPSTPTVMTTLHYPAHFLKGSIIQLANGELKSVEELCTQDFVNSAELSDDLKIDSSTVTHIEENKNLNTCIMRFSVGPQQVQVSVEAALEHPFFVFGQGWSSCLPERTQQRYNLQCKKLQVGDVCISLTNKDQVSTKSSVPVVHSIRQDNTQHNSNKASDVSTRGVIISPQVQNSQTEFGRLKQITSSEVISTNVLPSSPSARCYSRKRRWSAPDEVGEESKPTEEFS